MSKQLSYSEIREIESKALNTPGLRNRKGFGLKKNGECKNGYHRLRDGRIIYLKDLEAKVAQKEESNDTSKKEEEE